MNYIGSKHTLLPFLERSITLVAGPYRDGQTFCDLFAGTGAVGRHFKRIGYQVTANDLQYYSYVLNRQYIGNHTILMFHGLEEEIPQIRDVLFDNMRGAKVCEYLNFLKPIEGFVYQNYCKGRHQDGEDYRLYFSDDNGGRCDAIRQKIEQWRGEGKLTEGEYFFLLATLIEGIDRVANTASVYGAFLKRLKRSAQKPLTMKPAEMIYNGQEHYVYNEDANQLARHLHVDILYLDPPYNQRQYSANYHLLETIALYDSPQITGKTGMRDYSGQRSQYCSRSSVKEAFRQLIQEVDAHYIFLSYNNEGLMTFDDIRSIMEERGRYGCFKQEYGRFKADNESDTRHIAGDKTTEYIHYIALS